MFYIFKKILVLLVKGIGADGEAEKSIQENAQGDTEVAAAAKPKDSALASDHKQPGETGAGAADGAPQAGGGAAAAAAAAAAGSELHVVPQKQAQAGDKNAKLQPPVKAAVVPGVNKAGEEAIVAGGPGLAAAAAAAAAAVVAPAGHEERELGARGVPLGQGRRGDAGPAAKNDGGALPKEETIVKELEKDSVERLEVERERLEKERIEKEVQARVEKERLEREKRERLAREELERFEKEKEKLAKEKAARETAEREQKERLEKMRKEQDQIEEVRKEEQKLQQELQKMDSEINARALEEEEEKQKQQARQAQLERAKAAQESEENEIDEPLKKGGRDLKVRLEEREDQALVAAAAAPLSQEKDTDLRRRRRAVDPLGPGRMPRLEPLLELGGADLHAALEGQLLGGAMVHSRGIKQAAEPEKEI